MLIEITELLVVGFHGQKGDHSSRAFGCKRFLVLPLHVSSNGIDDLEFGIVSLCCLMYSRSFSQPASVSNESAINQQ